MKKLLLLLMALLTLGVSGAWATDGYVTVKIADGTTSNGPATYGDANSGTVNGNPAVTFKSTWTSTALSGMAGLTLSAKTSADDSSNALAEETAYGSFHCLGFRPSAGNATDVLTITAPTGYIITGYYIEAGYWTSGEKYTLTANAGTGTTSYTTNAAPSNGTKGLEVSGVNATSTTISIQSNQAANTRCLMMNKFTVTIFPKELFDAKASINSGKLYRIFTKNNGTEEGETKYYLTTTGTLTNDMASAGQFVFSATTNAGYVPAGYAWKISNGSNRFTNRPSNAPGQSKLNLTSSNDRDTYEAQVFYLNGGKYAVRSTNYDGSGSQYVQNSYWTVVEGDGVPNATYDDTEGVKHYVWQIEEIASITYNLIFQGGTIKTLIKDRANAIGTAALPEASWNNECCAYSFSPSTITSETETVNITMTWNIGDLTFSSDYASATWYHMSLHDKWAKYDASVNGSQGHPLSASLNDVNYDVAGTKGMWAFVGNPVDGVFIINRAAGDGQVLGWTTPPKMQGTNQSSSRRFIITKYGDPATGFILNYSGYYINDYEDAGQLKFWNDGRGATASGSAITVEPISPYELALIELDVYASSHAEGQYFGLKSSSVTSLRTSIKTAKASFNDAAYSTAHTAIEALWPGTDNANVIFPEAGFYRLKNKGAQYMGVSGSTFVGNITQSASASDPSTIIRIERSGTDGVKLATQGKYGQEAFAAVDVTLGNDPVSYFSLEAVTPGNGAINTNSAAGDYAYYSVYNNKISGWSASDNTEYWVFEPAEEVTVNLNSDGGAPATYYATFCAPFSYTVGSGAMAYTLEQSGEWLVPHEVEGEVPAGTPVLLKGTSATTTLTIGSGYEVTPLTTTALTGTYLATTIDGSSDFVLGKSNGVVGFYHWNSNNLGANRAYFDTPAAPGVKGFGIIWGGEDGINAARMNTEEVNTEKLIYNLAGQRMSKLQKGVNIINGKKMVVK